MSINTNLIPNPVQDKISVADLPLKERGIVTVVFEKNQEKLTVTGGRFPCELRSNDIAFLSDVVDPQGKLKSLIAAGKVIKIQGNCAVGQAQVILLDDTDHTNKDQPLVNGEVANRLKGDENVYLCEAVEEPRRIFTGEIGDCFAPNLKIGAKDYFSGWDDMYIYDLSYQLEIPFLEACEKAISGIEVDSDFENNNHIAAYYDHLRTESLFHAIQKKHQVFPNAKICVWGGQRHLSEEWLHEQLANHSFRYIEITPGKAASCTLAELIKCCGFESKKH